MANTTRKSTSTSSKRNSIAKQIKEETVVEAPIVNEEIVEDEDVVQEDNIIEIVKKEDATITPVTKREYKGDDLIPCRSLTRGELLVRGKKTSELYKFADFNDVTEIEYQDLIALKAAKSDFIYKVMFVIEDEELLRNTKWSDVRRLYRNIYTDDIEEILAMKPDAFKNIFNSLPEGLKKALIIEVTTQIEAGTFDSIQKVNYIDEMCGTDLKMLLI